MKKYYQAELNILRTLAQEFAEVHPAIAPMLAAQGTDPDVERLLEGTAYLCAFIQERIDAGFPEIVESLVKLTFPHMLLPTPSLSLVQFTAMQGIRDPLFVKKGTKLASVPVEGVSCLYTLVQDMTILPVDIASVTLEPSSASEADLNIVFSPRAPLALWWPSTLRLYVTGEYAQASQQLYMLLSCTRGLTVKTESSITHLDKSSLQLAETLGSDQPLYSEHTLMRMYYAFPQQFLFLNVLNLQQVHLSNEDTTLSITFHLQGALENIPPFGRDSFALNVAKVINVSEQRAEPIRLDHSREEYLIRPEDAAARELSIMSVTSVKGIRPGGSTHEYKAYESFSATQWTGGTYTTHTRRSSEGKYLEHYLSVLYVENDPDFQNETLSIGLHCYNHTLPSRLRIGDICMPTDSSPAMASFQNIVVPSSPFEPPQDQTMYWQFLSHLNINLLPLSTAETLQSLLRLYVPNDTLNPQRTQSNMKRIEAINTFASSDTYRLYRGMPIRGRNLLLTLNRKDFASQGDMYIFCCLLDEHLGIFASLNTFTRLELVEKESKEHFFWPPRLGRKQLL